MAGHVVAASAARTVSGATGALPMTSGDELIVELEVTAVAGTSPTLDVSIEWSNDGGTDFAAAEPVDVFSPVGTPAVLPYRGTRKFEKKGDHYRVVWTIGGVAPSYTFEVLADYM